MNSDLAVMSLVRRVYAELGFEQLVPEQDLERGYQELQAGAAQVALEIVRAEMKRVPLHEAANDEVNFPHFFRLHTFVRDILTLELPAELREWAKGVLALKELKVGEELFLALAHRAADTLLPALERALGKLALFELVRLGLLVQEHLSDGDFVTAGIRQREIDQVAAEQVDWWVGQSAVREGTRPLPLLAAAAMVQLQRYAQHLRVALFHANPEDLAELERRRGVETRLHAMNSPDALLLRNQLAESGVFPEQYVTVETLQRMHPDVLGDRKRNALDKQLSRIRVKIEEGEWPKRKKEALIDLIIAAARRENE